MIETRGPGARSGFEKQKPHYFTKDNVTRLVGTWRSRFFMGTGQRQPGRRVFLLQFLHAQSVATAHRRGPRRDSRVPCARPRAWLRSAYNYRSTLALAVSFSRLTVCVRGWDRTNFDNRLP